MRILQRFIPLFFMAVSLALLVAACGRGGGSSGTSGGGGAGTPGSGGTVAHNQWAWVSGSSVVGAKGIYGTLGAAAASNVPGAREQSASWIDGAGNRWLFGGAGYDSTGAMGALNDLWKFDGANWTWVSGSNVVNTKGVYGAPGVAAPGNVPGARMGHTSWKDGAGNLWLFGGYGYDSAGSPGYLNDLWKFDGANWTWVSGSSVAAASGAYGTQGVAAPANAPGARSGAAGWVDSSGNRWLFGGNGYDAAGTLGYLNDLWKFDGANWTWVSGSSVANATGVYGTQGAAAATSVPGARVNPARWIDSSGNRWLFGGFGYDSAGTTGELNDLWKFDGANWTWVSGSSVIDTRGVYGTQGIAAASNVPGARSDSASWTDSAGNRWLFGGMGWDSAGTKGHLNDLWKFDGANWTWVSGSSVANAKGIYGTPGAGAASDVAGARLLAVSWIDANGKLWLFGGWGYASTATQGMLNDLWSYTP